MEILARCKFVSSHHRRMGENLQMIYKQRVPAWVGGVVNQMITIVLLSKQRRRVIIVHNLKERWNGNWWLIGLSEEVTSSFSTVKVISTDEVFKYLLAEIPCSCRSFFSSATFIALKSVLILRSTILSYSCSWTLNWFRRISLSRYPRLQNRNTIRYHTKFRVAIKACLRPTAIRGHKFPTKRVFIWQSTLLSSWKYLIRYITISTQN